MKYQEEIQALLKKAERSLRAARSMIDSQDFDFSLSTLWRDRLFWEGNVKSQQV
jgi:uncharacterized protein (UPF0332 family)